jgi:hypothetical protein
MAATTELDPTALWQAEAAWAVERWRAIFDPVQQQFLQPTTINNSRSYVLASDAARAAFEEVAQLVIQRVRELLAKRRLPHHIGSPEMCAALLVDPLRQKAIDSVNKISERAAKRGFQPADNMVDAPLTKTRQKIETRADTLHAAIMAEVAMRHEELGQSTKPESSQAQDRAPQPETARRAEGETPEVRALRALAALDLHPAVSRAATKLFHDGHYANAVEDACKALDALVQVKSGRNDLSGTDLMQTVFSPKLPILVSVV